jgi:hypothetical protein
MKLVVVAVEQVILEQIILPAMPVLVVMEQFPLFLVFL